MLRRLSLGEYGRGGHPFAVKHRPRSQQQGEYLARAVPIFRPCRRLLDSERRSSTNNADPALVYG
jgi:hypothetical protein